MRIKIIILILLISFFVFAGGFKSIYFNGSFIFDEESGITIIPADNKEIIAITNLVYHYALILPYAENWEITLDEKYILFATNKSISVSLELLKNDGVISEKYLENLMKIYIENNAKFGIIEAKIIKHKNEYVFATIINAKLLYNDINYEGIKQINYFSTKTYKEERFNMHLSFLQKGDKVDLNNIELLNYLTIGFNIDFERDKK